MGVHPKITAKDFPRQSDLLGKRVLVMFHYGKPELEGECVRDDVEDPGEQIFKLDDGRFVRSVECQWRPKNGF